MIAYTAWDSLQAIAREYGADLALVPGEQRAMAPQRERAGTLLALRNLYGRLRSRRS